MEICVFRCKNEFNRIIAKRKTSGMEGVKLVLRTALSGSQTKVLLSFVNPKRKVSGCKNASKDCIVRGLI